MSIRFDTVDFTIPPGIGQRSFTEDVVFSSDVLRAGVALNRLDLEFVGNVDHDMGRVMGDAGIDLIDGDTVTVRFSCQFRDKDNNDAYQGNATVLLSAEIA